MELFWLMGEKMCDVQWFKWNINDKKRDVWIESQGHRDTIIYIYFRGLASKLLTCAHLNIGMIVEFSKPLRHSKCECKLIRSLWILCQYLAKALDMDITFNSVIL